MLLVELYYGSSVILCEAEPAASRSMGNDSEGEDSNATTSGEDVKRERVGEVGLDDRVYV